MMRLKLVKYLTTTAIFIILLINKSNLTDIVQECDNLSNICYKKTNEETSFKRYLFYDVNYGEGFNLRRDVYIRVAILVKKLRESNSLVNWVLVLPPWSRIYHWFNRNLDQDKLPWSLFFDLKSLNRYVPVIEFEQFRKEIDYRDNIDQVLYLQHYKEGWTEGGWIDKYDFRECNEKPVYEIDHENNYYWGYFWGYSNEIRSSNFTCVSFQGTTSLMIKLIEKNYQKIKSILIDRAEVMLHEFYGQKEYWNCRRSMRFSSHLIEAANEFRAKYLDSNDFDDKTVLDDNWTIVKKNHGDAIGGPYIAVHLRRGDFVRSHSRHIPTLKYAAKQIRKLLRKFNLKRLFIASDTTNAEFNELKTYLKGFNVFRYEPNESELIKYKDGGVAIIDQIICSHAFYFIGTYESTFTFRIQEEREILGFYPNTTFNRLCSESYDPSTTADEANFKCEESSKWLIVY